MHKPTVTPYNTGKVLIGSRYEPPKYIEESSHMLNLQRVLLEKKTERRSVAAADLVIMVLAVVAAVVIYLTR
ncbi:MAG: hypothetical protein ACO242_02995 [Candidatus Fonsibacter ubiquis]